MRPGFTILDHPADLGIEATGSTLSEAFSFAAKGLISVILDAGRAEARDEVAVSLNASDIQHLLVRWLGEVLYLYDGRRFVGIDFHIHSLTPTRLDATVSGEPFDSSKHEARLDVKAVTYHQLLVELDERGARVRVFLDI